VKTFTVARLWTLRRAENIPRAATDAAVIGFGLAALAIWISLDRWQAGDGAQFQLWDTLTISIYGMLVLCLAFVLSRASRPRIEFRTVLFVLVAALPILVAVGFFILWRMDGRAAIGALMLLCLYAILYTLKALRSLSGRWQPRAVTAAIVLVGAFSSYSRMEELSPTLWSPAAAEDTAEETDMAPAVAEGLLFDQRAQIDEAVDQMNEIAGADPAVYFVGFAGVAEQHVFAEEIKLAARVIDERFDTSARQLLLINDRRDLDSFPIATASGLSYALGAVAQKMNTDRDILFLALSSHGSQDPLLSVSNGSLPLEQLSGDDLDTALRESGIKWRIIVISACHAGAFIESLQNPDTVVITAAAADKTSFGCSDDRDLTYFGEAFYRDALPGAKTLQQAFEQARAAIAVREKQEHQTPSDPQAFFGRDITAMLERHPMRSERRGTLSAGLSFQRRRHD